MKIVKQVLGLQVRLGGEQHTGWLPEGAALPLPTPVRDVTMDITIEFDGFGYLLCYEAQDGSVYGDTWHETLEDAEEAALKYFHIGLSQWRNGS